MVGNMATVTTPSKTEQRVSKIIGLLKRTAPNSVTYDELSRRTGTSHDVLLYVLTALVEVGMVEREDVADGPGRPRVFFTWVASGLGPG